MKLKKILAGTAVAVIATGGGALAGRWLLDGDVSHAAQPVAAAITPQRAVAGLWTTPVSGPDGKPGSLARFKGHPVVINFWASWCGPCVEEMPSLVKLHGEYAKQGIEFIGLGVDSEKNVSAFLQKVPVDYPVYVIGFGGADLARTFGNTAGALPFTVVIDAKGNIRSTKLGQIQPKELKQTLDAL